MYVPNTSNLSFRNIDKSSELWQIQNLRRVGQDQWINNFFHKQNGPSENGVYFFNTLPPTIH